MMHYYDVKRLGCILAIQAEIEGMKAENEQRKISNESPAYVFEHFQDKAEEIRSYVYRADEQL